jgi:HEPN domain-containing protein
MRDKEVNKWLRAAAQRLTSAKILFENSMYLDCMYIAGYASECSFKAMILSRIPSQRRNSYIRKHFRGAVTHDYEYLKHLLKQLNVNIPPTVSRTLRTIASWSTDLRYEVGRKKPQEAQEFLSSVKTILNWAERSL